MKDYVDVSLHFWRYKDLLEEFPVMNTMEWEVWTEQGTHRKYIFARTFIPNQDPWFRPMLPFRSRYSSHDESWQTADWPKPDMDELVLGEKCMMMTSVAGKTVRIWRRNKDWVDPYLPKN